MGPMTNKNGSSYQFGVFTLDVRQGVLLRGSEPVKLPAKAFELLLFLVKNPNQVIDKETLMGEVWKDAFVEDANLAVHISNLRKVLNGDVDGKSAIETFPKIGYRFNGEVKIANEENGLELSVEPDADQLAPRLKRRSLPKYVVYFAGVLILMAPAYLGFRWLRPWSPDPPIISRLSGFEQVSAYALSPDGQYAAQALRQNARFSLTMIHLGSNSRFPLVPPGDLSFGSMKFSSDGFQLYYTRATPDAKFALYRTPFLSPESVKLVDDVGQAIGISPSNDRVCFVRQVSRNKNEIIIAKLDGTEERTLAAREGDETYWPWSIDWSPDGRLIAATITKAGQNGNSRIVTLNVDTGEELAIAGPVWAAGGGEGLAWNADGSGIVFSASDLSSGSPSQLWFVAFPSGEITKLTNDVEAYAVPYVSKDGQIMSAQFADADSIWIDAAPFGSAVPLTSPYKHSLNWVRSNSLGQIVFGSSALGNRDVWLINQDGSGERRLTQNAGNNVMPVPSEDGRFVVFASNRSAKDKYNLWRMDLDGSDARQLTHGDGEVQPTISPDGQWVYFSAGGLSGGNSERTLWRVRADGGEPERFVDGFANGADVSPDGKFVAAWYKPPSSGWKLAVFRSDGGLPLKLFDAEPGVPVKWTPDGKAIAYLKTVNGVSNVWKQSLAGGAPERVTGFTSMRTLNFDWTVDDHIICTRNERTTNVVMIRNFR